MLRLLTPSTDAALAEVSRAAAEAIRESDPLQAAPLDEHHSRVRRCLRWRFRLRNLDQAYETNRASAPMPIPGGGYGEDEASDRRSECDP
jgi:hypothetical protein